MSTDVEKKDELELELVHHENTWVTPETYNQAQPYNGKQNQKEHSVVKEASDKMIYANPPAGFKLDIEEITMLKGETHHFNVTPEPITANAPILVWECSLDEDGRECCYVQEGILYAIAPSNGKVKVTAFDITDPNPKNITKQEVSVTVLEKPVVVKEPAATPEDNGDSTGG